MVQSKTNHLVAKATHSSSHQNSKHNTTVYPPKIATDMAKTRRDLIASTSFAMITSFLLPPSDLVARAADLVPPPSIGDCPECIGEVKNTLNTCKLDSISCISTLNDDEVHFQAPWQYDEMSRDDAIAQLIYIATGGSYDSYVVDVDRLDAAKFIAQGVVAVYTNNPDFFPDRPKLKKTQSSTNDNEKKFNGTLVDRHTTENGSEYLRFTFGDFVEQMDDATMKSGIGVIDAEFLFFPDDSIVNIRASSRQQPESGGLDNGQIALSFTNGLVVDKNVARRTLERLRVALRWELTPVVTDFNPAFNPEAPVWLEKVFRPFDKERNGFVPSGIAYPTSE